MGKLNRGFNQTALNGSIGAVTYVTRKGITVAKQKVPAKLIYRKTVRSMSPRMRWMALVRLWQVLNSVGWRPSFLNKSGLQSDFNMFMQANSAVDAFLTKTIVSAKGAVVLPAIITNGGLPTVGGSFNASGSFVSAISLGGTSIGASTTVGTLAEAIIDNNPGWLPGDQLTIVMLTQTTDEVGIPRIEGVIGQVYLDPDDEETLLGNLFDANVLSAVDGKLAIGANLVGGAAVVHSTGEGDTYDVSAQQLVVSSADVYAAYMGNNALMAAIDSYGGLQSNDFLIPEPSDNTPQG